MKVDFIDIPELPWLFRLPFQGKKAKTQEPIKHRRKLKRLTKAIFRIPDDSSSSSLIEKMSNASIQFERGDEKQLILDRQLPFIAATSISGTTPDHQVLKIHSYVDKLNSRKNP